MIEDEQIIKKQIVKRTHYIVIDDSNKIALHQITCNNNSDIGKRPALILCHGITYSSLAVFDIPIEGVSFAEHLACLGFDVFMLDYLGYGKSIFKENIKVNLSSAVSNLSVCIDNIIDREYSKLL